MGIKDAVQQFMSQEESIDIEDFGLWAFGDQFKKLDHSLKLMNEWNKLHGDCLYLRADGSIAEDIPKMLQLWRYAKEN